jgi:hypothetical protein
MLQLIETDAKAPYTKLLDTVPVSDEERRRWVAFLLAQMLRTPSFMLRILPALKRYIETAPIAFPTDTGSLRKAHETLFCNNDLYAEFFRLLAARQWKLWRAPSSATFIRGDNPLVIRGPADRGTWQLVYSMTPGACFVVGTENVADTAAVVPQTDYVSEAQVALVNQWVANAARRSVIAQPAVDDSALRVLLHEGLAPVSATGDLYQQCFPEFWGAIAPSA